MNSRPIVAIVDDEEMVTQSIRSFLELETDYDVLTYQCPVKALDALTHNPPDIIVSDFLMPEMNGLQFLSKIKNVYPNVPRVLLTAYADKENAIKGINDVGLYQYIQKPWENENLKLVIQNGINTKSLNTALEQKIKELENSLVQQNRLETEKDIFQAELNLAKDIHNKLLPRKPLSFGKINISTFYKPSFEIGGDYYDVIHLADDYIAVMLADLTGHGIQAALCTALFKFAFTAFKNSTASAGEIMAGVNEVLQQGLPNDVFASGLVLKINTTTLECEMVNAGNPHPYLVHKTENMVEKLAANGMMLGIIGEPLYEVGEPKIFTLDEQKSLVVFTDGLSEARNVDEQFLGEKEIVDILKSPFESGDEVITKLINRVDDFQDVSKADDLTILTIEC